MTFKTLSATKARNNWFELLNSVYFTGEPVVIERNNKPIARLVPEKGPNLNKMPVGELIKKTHGFLKDAPLSSWPKENKAVARKKAKYLKSLWKK